jgi:hypothetical protein
MLLVVHDRPFRRLWLPQAPAALLPAALAGGSEFDDALAAAAPPAAGPGPQAADLTR